MKKILSLDSRLEAEAIGNALEQQGIPVLVKSEDLGIFGPGHTGATPQGATLWIPDELVEKAKSLLSCFFSEDESEMQE